MLVQESVADEVIDKLTERISTLRLGDPMDKNTDIGAINSASQLATITALADSGEDEGAQRWTAPCPIPDRGDLLPPTVFTEVSQSMRIAREEIFGPVLSVLTFRTPDEAVAEGEQHALRPVGRGMDGEGFPNPRYGESVPRGPAWCGQTRSTDSTRRPHSGATRSPASVVRAEGQAWPPIWTPMRGRRDGPADPGFAGRDSPSDGSPDDRRQGDDCQDLQAVRGWGLPSERERAHLPGSTIGGGSPRTPPRDREDARDAVSAARKGFGSWSRATAYNRGQVIYRIAEMLEGRRAQFVDLLTSVEGVTPQRATTSVDSAIDRLVHFAGWTDKLAAVYGGANPVAGPFFSFSTPEPTGVVAAVAPPQDSLLGLVSVIAPIITSGNAVVVVASTGRPLPAVTLAEVLATSDLPGGVVNVLTGDPAEIMPHLAAHGDVNGLDLTGADDELRASLAEAAAGTVKRVFVPSGTDFGQPPGTARMRAFLETKTVWHPTGAVSLAGGSGY